MSLIPIAGFSDNVISNVPLLIAVSFGLAYIVMPAFLLHIWPARKQPTSKSMQDALWDGELSTREYRVLGAAQIEEVEDEGLHFLLSIDTGETLYLRGQDLYGPVDRRTFPSELVRVFTNRVSGLRYGVEPIGRAFQSWPVYTSITEQLAPSVDPLEDGTLYKQSIAELVARFALRPVDAGA